MTAERRHITHERRDDIARRIRDLTLALEVLNHTIHDYVGRPRGRTVQGPWIAPGPKLPRCRRCLARRQQRWRGSRLLDDVAAHRYRRARIRLRSEEHTSELQSRGQLVCRRLLEKKQH